MRQTWIVVYPFLAYKNFTPDNREICIVHLAQKGYPQKIINLGDFEFVSFVHHTLMCEQKLFGKMHETNCDIMFLAENQGKIRLMSFKSNPWLSTQQMVSVKSSIHISTGFLTMEAIKKKVSPKHDSDLNRFTPDKI